MTKGELAAELAELKIDRMDYGDIVSLAYEHIKQNLVRLPKVDLLAQYLHFGNTGELLEHSDEKSVDNKSPL